MIDFDAILKQLRAQHPKQPAGETGEDWDVVSWASALLHEDQWDEDQLNFFHGWMKKLDVTRVQYANYKADWSLLKDKKPLPEQVYEISSGLALLSLAGIQESSAQWFKTMNVLFKILDRVETVGGQSADAIKEQLLAQLQNSQPHQPAESVNGADEFRMESASHTLDLTVLFAEGPIARAYLATLKAAGFRVKRLVQLVFENDLVSQKPVGRWLPQSMRLAYAANKQFKQMFYWPHQLLKNRAGLVQEIQAQISDSWSMPKSAMQTAYEPMDFSGIADEVVPMMFQGLKDPCLATWMAAQEAGLFLYTGGGIVPAELLSFADKRLIHIHPGFLPSIRGADCVLWSQLMHRHTSASAFFMVPGIDEGDVISPAWLPEVAFDFPNDMDLASRYRMIYGFVDPWVRASVLKKLLLDTGNLTRIDAIAQLESAGVTFHFMHDSMKAFAIDQFAAGRSSAG